MIEYKYNEHDKIKYEIRIICKQSVPKDKNIVLAQMPFLKLKISVSLKLAG